MKHKINSLENNYNEIKLYFRQMKKGLITAEEFADKKKQLFEDDGWETEYGKLKEKRIKEYRYRAYVALFSLYYLNGAISQEEFEQYSKRLV